MIYKPGKKERKKERKKARKREGKKEGRKERRKEGRKERKNMAKLTVNEEGWSYMDEGTLLPKSQLHIFIRFKVN
jgi:hypothetical protein